MQSATPIVFLLRVWPLPRSLATTCGISVDFFSSPYLDVSVQAVPLLYLFDSVQDTWTSPCGFLHSEIRGSMDICSSPRLIAAYHVLRRLPVPRHSPCALLSLTMRYITYPSSELVMRESLLLHSTNIVVYPNILLFMGFTLLYLIRSFRCSIFKVRFEWVSS